jgi:tRNA U38,U39,U40 pseudouridine synthase TruA
MLSRNHHHMAATDSASLTNASAVVINPYSNAARQLRMDQATNQVVGRHDGHPIATAQGSSQERQKKGYEIVS